MLRNLASLAIAIHGISPQGSEPVRCSFLAASGSIFLAVTILSRTPLAPIDRTGKNLGGSICTSLPSGSAWALICRHLRQPPFQEPPLRFLPRQLQRPLISSSGFGNPSEPPAHVRPSRV